MDKIKNKIETFLALFLLLGLGVFGYIKVAAYLDYYNYKNDLTDSLISINESIRDMSDEISSATLTYQDTTSDKNSGLSDIFPVSEDLTSLTRAFDEFEVSNNFSNSPFFISSISYGKSSASDDSQYRILPIQMSIESSEDNFYKFLEYIETSGNLDSGIRLMSIGNVSIDLEEDEDQENFMSYNLDLNAYFQN